MRLSDTKVLCGYSEIMHRILYAVLFLGKMVQERI